jgi:hypothetical protein
MRNEEKKRRPLPSICLRFANMRDYITLAPESKGSKEKAGALVVSECAFH